MRPPSNVEQLPEERHAAMIGDQIDALEAFQTPHPHQGLEDVISSLRFVRDSLLKQAAARLAEGSDDALRYYGDPEEFLRACAERARAEGGLHAGRAFERLIEDLLAAERVHELELQALARQLEDQS